MADRESHRARIVVADDQLLFHSALAGLLEEGSGAEVVARAADGRQAMELSCLGTDLVLRYMPAQ